jgi:hypothetical protein
MSHRVSLNERQLELLRWIADGCPAGVMPDESHRISAAALRNRGLATTAGRGATWTAQITPAGTQYLQGLDHVDEADPEPQPASPPAAAAGRRRSVTQRDSYHPVARAFRDRIERHEVSRRQMQRATGLIQTIVTMALERGWQVELATESENEFGLVDWSSAKDGHLTIDIGEQRFWLRVQEEGVGTRGALEDDESASYDRDGTGRLKLELRWGEWFTRQQTRWVDREGAALEGRLDDVFREMATRHADSVRVAEEKRAKADRMAADERVQAQAREREWAQHMARARERYFQAKRAQALRDQTQAFAQAAQVRAYCQALAAAHPSDQETGEWIAWALAYAEEIDPSSRRQRVPHIEDPAPAALQAFLPEGWSARGP